jgi:hypothetical protein
VRRPVRVATAAHMGVLLMTASILQQKNARRAIAVRSRRSTSAHG